MWVRERKTVRVLLQQEDWESLEELSNATGITDPEELVKFALDISLREFRKDWEKILSKADVQGGVSWKKNLK
jgi:hypothetical protein